MLLGLIQGRVDFTDAVIYILSALVVIFLTLPFHEFAHAFVADKLGDKTARYQRRLTISPFAHIDYFGALAIILFGFGWARPVPVSPRNFKNAKRGMAITAAAGPVMNIILAFIACFFSCAISSGSSRSMLIKYLKMFLSDYVSINIGLAVFNIIPIPPLDGWKVLGSLLPDRIYWRVMQYERYISFALILIVYMGILDGPINFISGFLINVVSFIPRLVFGY